MKTGIFCRVFSWVFSFKYRFCSIIQSLHFVVSLYRIYSFIGTKLCPVVAGVCVGPVYIRVRPVPIVLRASGPSRPLSSTSSCSANMQKGANYLQRKSFLVQKPLLTQKVTEKLSSSMHKPMAAAGVAAWSQVLCWWFSSALAGPARMFGAGYTEVNQDQDSNLPALFRTSKAYRPVFSQNTPAAISAVSPDKASTCGCDSTCVCISRTRPGTQEPLDT